MFLVKMRSDKIDFYLNDQGLLDTYGKMTKALYFVRCHILTTEECICAVHNVQGYVHSDTTMNPRVKLHSLNRASLPGELVENVITHCPHPPAPTLGSKEKVSSQDWKNM